MAPAPDGIHRLGLLGGTFDPIHRAHLALAEYAADRMALDAVWFIPASVPPHKRRRDMAPPDIRWEMTVSAVAPFAPRFVPVDIELRRAGYSFTVDTIREVRAQVGPDCELFWIIGSDNIGEIPRWYEPDEIAALATIVAGGRPGARVPPELPDWLRSRLVVLDGPLLDISSTAIRARVHAGEIPENVLPEPVRAIIARERLYGFPGPVPRSS